MIFENWDEIADLHLPVKLFEHIIFALWQNPATPKNPLYSYWLMEPDSMVMRLEREAFTTGEIAFNTGMYGYQEIFTDPSYHRQILVMATSHVGNYGVHDAEVESGRVQIAGLVTKNFSSIASRVGGAGTSAGLYGPGQCGWDLRFGHPCFGASHSTVRCDECHHLQ